MKHLIYRINAGCAFDIKNDPLILAFSCIANGFEANCYAGYGRICRILLSENKSLAQYLHDMLVYGEHEFLANCAAAPTEQQKKAVEFDVESIRQLSEYSSEKLKELMSDRCDSEVLSALPDYVQGSFGYTADHFISHAAKYGIGALARYKAFSFDGEQLIPIENTDPIRLSDLKNYEVQRRMVVENTDCFVAGTGGQNVLLYGDRGTGKSSTVKALLNNEAYSALRMIEIAKETIGQLPKLYEMLRKSSLRFILLIDDLTFSADDDRYNTLKAALEGSLQSRPDNVLIYATTNRRKLVKASAYETTDGDTNNADAADESMSLSDRFGLYVTFSLPDKAAYLDIVRQLAEERVLPVNEEQLYAAAERYALRRGGRSPRIARQCVEYISSRIAMGMEF